MMSAQASHPFPYFGLKATRNLARVQQKINEKYQWAKAFEHHPFLLKQSH